MKKYVLDTSAILAYIENEEGVETVEELLKEALERNIEIFISIISCIEVYYISLKEQGEKIALDRLDLINDLMIKIVPLNEQFTKIIGEFKTNKNMSLADCCIAGLAKVKKAILIHKDPEFIQLENEIKQLKLPYKPIIKSKQ